MTMEEKAALFDLIYKNPGEMGFIIDCDTYSEYLATYTDVGLEPDEATYTEEEFNALKSGFGGNN